MKEAIRYAALVVIPFILMNYIRVDAQRESQNESVAMDVTAPYPTLIHLSVEWRVRGDDNLDGVVSVRFRETGSQKWRIGMPLRRVPAGTLPVRRWARRRRGEPRPNPPPPPDRIFEWANKHSGSLFDLAPDTEYEIELTLVDPDGGDAVKRLTARTRPEPEAMKNAPVKRVTPETIGDATPSPGDIVLLAPGEYGDFTAEFDGEDGKPIVYRSDDGTAVFTRILLTGRSYVHVEGVTVVNSEERGRGIVFSHHGCGRRA